MPQHLVLYDDQCPLCTFQMRVLSWLDWFNQLALVPLSAPEARAAATRISPEDLRSAIHSISPDGTIHRGARCIRFVALRLPVLVPVALFLWLPGVIWIAELLYRWVSNNRLLLSRWFGCSEACAVMPKRDRNQDRWT
jgi:predicted DCC family thiol-disulfide oxidoreductase YuxK